MNKIKCLLFLLLSLSLLAPASTFAYDASNGYIDSLKVLSTTTTTVFTSLNGVKKTLFLHPDVTGHTQADRMFSQLLTALIKGKICALGTASSTEVNITYVTIVR